MKVVYKQAFDAKSRGRSIPQKYGNYGKYDKNTVKIRQKLKNSYQSPTQEIKFNFVKIFLSSLINGGTQV